MQIGKGRFRGCTRPPISPMTLRSLRPWRLRGWQTVLRPGLHVRQGCGAGRGWFRPGAPLRGCDSHTEPGGKIRARSWVWRALVSSLSSAARAMPYPRLRWRRTSKISALVWCWLGRGVSGSVWACWGCGCAGGLERIALETAMVCLPPAGELRLGRVRCFYTGRCPLALAFGHWLLAVSFWRFGSTRLLFWFYETCVAPALLPVLLF